MQCLQTSDDISHWKSGCRARPQVDGPVGIRRAGSGGPTFGSPGATGRAAVGCSMKATWRQVSAPRPWVLSYDMPVKFRPSSGTAFHSLQATSQALQPMQTLVSVKKPLRAGGSTYTRAWATIGIRNRSSSARCGSCRHDPISSR